MRNESAKSCCRTFRVLMKWMLSLLTLRILVRQYALKGQGK